MKDLNFLQNLYSDQSNVFPRNYSIVVVEDDIALGNSVKKYLQKTFPFNVFYFQGPKECIAEAPSKIKGHDCCLITNSNFGNGLDGCFLFNTFNDLGISFFSIVLTEPKNHNIFAKKKAEIFSDLTKPFELVDLCRLVQQGFEDVFDRKKTSQNLNLFSPSRAWSIREDDIFCGMVGRSSLMKNIFEMVKKVAKVDSTVLITGPSGVGKELVAQAIHHLSFRSQEKKINVNCGAIPEGLLESELFGHNRGAFTGAISDRMGRFEQAHKGSIFLDEIGDMSLSLQVKLLRVLQTKQIERVGGNRSINVDVRVITATHRNLEELIAEKKFREDLYYRFNVIPVRVPSLKERREDVPILISYFLSRYSNGSDPNSIHFDERALDILLNYDWPGNVRELENIIERLMILRRGDTVRVEDLPDKICQGKSLYNSRCQRIFNLPEEGLNIKKVLSEMEDSLILQALDRTNGNKNRASKLLSLNRTTLIEKMKKKNIALNI